jgi:hypothetical protein
VHTASSFPIHTLAYVCVFGPLVRLSCTLFVDWLFAHLSRAAEIVERVLLNRNLEGSVVTAVVGSPCISLKNVERVF